jgi:hypothetical protein
MTPEDLTVIEQSSRRCSVCRTGRRWRTFEVVRHEGRQPVVMCGGCRARFGDLAPPPAPAETASAGQAAAEQPAQRPAERRHKRRRPPRPRESEDRLKRALRTLPPGGHSTGRIAKAAGLNEAKVLSRLERLEAAGEVHRVGRRWSTERPSTDLDAAFDRLQARTSNLRIVRDGERDRDRAR